MMSEQFIVILLSLVNENMTESLENPKRLLLSLKSIRTICTIKRRRISSGVLATVSTGMNTLTSSNQLYFLKRMNSQRENTQ